MGYNGINLRNSISVSKIYSIHYFEYMSDFTFEGESHNFWEFICVDKGEVGVTAGKTFTVLKKGDVAFHHLADIIIEARRCFDCRLDDPYLQNMPQKDPDMFGAEQLIRLYLEHFLIHLIRRYSNPIVVRKRLPKIEPPKATKSKSDTEIFNRVADYLESNLSSHVTIEQICRDNLIGRSQLQKIFKEHCNLGIIEYFSLLKINAAKEMIRTNRMNFTQISEHLGYTSIHYFSRQFKKVTGMTPSEYASSIKAMAEGSF